MVSAENIEVTMYPTVRETKIPYYRPLSFVLNRIKTGEKSRPVVEKVRQQTDKELANGIKEQLPAIIFSGKVGAGNRKGDNLAAHSGLVILDFDKLDDVQLSHTWREMTHKPYVVSAFKSPSGHGIKCLVRIADPSKHKEHYEALIREIPNLDSSNRDFTRVCYESYDPDIYINYNATPYTKFVETEKVAISVGVSQNDRFNKIERWLQNKNQAFESGNRNYYIFCLASACCRFGIPQEETGALIQHNYLSKDTTFKVREMETAIRSAYKSNVFGSAEFQENRFVEKETLKEIELEEGGGPIRDVIYGADVYNDALNIFNKGYVSAESTGVPVLDRIFKWKRGDSTVLTGIGNHGKSTMLKFLMLNKSVLDGSKWGIFGPEDFPAHEFYHDLTEMAIGANCTPSNPDKPREDIYEAAYKFIQQHFFYIYPKDLAPTPKYIQSRFLKLIMVEKVDGVVIDPFNQMANDYASTGGRDDKYLETFLADCTRFAIINNVFSVIVAHPKMLRKREGGGYDCPDVFDLAGGAMWNNKVDNILVYHRPNRHNNPMDRTCELHSKKIRRQKIVGEVGMEVFEYNRGKRRYVFDEFALKKLDFGYEQPFEQARGLNPEKRLRPLYGVESPFNEETT